MNERNGPTRYRVVVLTSWDRALNQGQALKLHRDTFLVGT